MVISGYIVEFTGTVSMGHEAVVIFVDSIGLHLSFLNFRCYWLISILKLGFC